MARNKTLAKTERPGLERWEPWDPFTEMERTFRDFALPFGFRRPRWLTEWQTEIAPQVDLRETETELVMSAVLPGMDKDDINIDVTKDGITISGERRREEDKPGETYHVRQQSYGSFRVCYGLPAEVKPDKVTATYKNGVLEVSMPKAEVTQAHKVKVDAK